MSFSWKAGAVIAKCVRSLPITASPYSKNKIVGTQRRLLSHENINHTLSKSRTIQNIVCAPWRLGQRKTGVDNGAAFIMDYVSRKLAQRPSGNTLLNKENTKIICPNMACISNERYHEKLFHARKEFRDHTLTIGGDHSVAIGSVLGSLLVHKQVYSHSDLKKTKKHYSNKMVIPRMVRRPSNSVHINNSLQNTQRQYSTEEDDEYYYGHGSDGDDDEMAVIWIDAHADINNYETSTSGNVHGMPLSFLTGLNDEWQWVNQHIQNKNNGKNYRLHFRNLYYWGVRDLDPPEIEIIQKHNIRICRSVDELKSVVDSYKFIHSSIDIDGLDPCFAPSTGTRSSDGLLLDDLLEYLAYVVDSNKSIAMDLVEYNPEIGDRGEQQTTKETLEKILEVIL